MAQPRLRYVLDAEFRSNPSLDIVELARLTATEQAMLPGLNTDDDCFGVLRPQAESAHGIKAVCKETALLFYALAVPGRLPSYVCRTADEVVNARIAALVLDGVLEIAAGGWFFSGAAAHHVICHPADPVESRGRIARVSMEALRFGQRLPVDDPMELSQQLYCFNRAPVTPRWQRHLRDDGALIRFLGTESGPVAKILRAEWTESPATAMRGWRRWSLRKHTIRRDQNTYGYKVYVSPTLDGIPGSLSEIVGAFTEARVRTFKIGEGLAGLARPDKIVAYLDSFEHVDELGRVLDERVGHVPVHGVPFTADLCRDGLASWGIDPHEPAFVKGHDRASWRLWLTNRLAVALFRARLGPPGAVEPWRFAVDRLGLDGIDTDTWTPLSGYLQHVATV